jgi:hypothetical protein
LSPMQIPLAVVSVLLLLAGVGAVVVLAARG